MATTVTRSPLKACNKLIELPSKPLRGRTELKLFAGVYAVYEGGRLLFDPKLATARDNAKWVIHLERSLGVFVEGNVQHDLSTGVLSTILANTYLAAQLVVLPAALLLVYHRSPSVYRRLRNVVAGAFLIATPIFALFPVAPPRLAGVGIADTVSTHAALAPGGKSTFFYNNLAAVPSLHVGLGFAIGIAIALTVKSRWAKALALAWGPIVTVTVIATGNHYLFDAAAGLLVAGAAFAATSEPVKRLAKRVITAQPRLRPAPRLATLRSRFS